jgi:PEP-CTERM motif-containing protein
MVRCRKIVACITFAVLSLIALGPARADTAFYVGPPLDAGPLPSTAPALSGPSGSPTPEPSTIALLAIGAFSLAAIGIRRRRG